MRSICRTICCRSRKMRKHRRRIGRRRPTPRKRNNGRTQMISRILVAYDGSDPANKAFSFALDLAKRYQASISVVAIAKPPEFGDDVETESILENLQKHYRHLLARLKPKALADGVNTTFEVAVGH